MTVSVLGLFLTVVSLVILLISEAASFVRLSSNSFRSISLCRGTQCTLSLLKVRGKVDDFCIYKTTTNCRIIAFKVNSFIAICSEVNERVFS